MQSNNSRTLGAIVAVVGVVAAIVLFVVLSGGDDPDSGGETTPVATESTTDQGGGGGGANEPGDQSGSPAGGGGQAEDDEPEAGKIPTIVVEGGQPVGGVQELSFDKGDEIRFAVESDVTDHVHLHGYDVMEDVAAGHTVEFDVPATIDGIFEVELEETVVPLAEITVNP